MDEEEIKEMGYERKGDNIYTQGDESNLFVQKDGMMMPVKKVDNETLKEICNYEKLQRLKHSSEKLDVTYTRHKGEEEEEKENEESKPWLWDEWLDESVERAKKIRERVKEEFSNIGDVERAEVERVLLEKGIKHIHWMKEERKKKQVHKDRGDNDD